MSERKSYYARKIKKATHILFFRHHKKSGVKGWELRKALGSDYPKVVNILNSYLKRLDLQVNTIFESGEIVDNPSLRDLDKARFYVTSMGRFDLNEARLIGWRIDDIAGLAISVAYVISKKGKAPRREVEELLLEKLPRWKVSLNLNRYIRYGYLTEDENQNLYLDWRTRAEVDQKKFIDLILLHEEREIDKKKK